MTAILWLPLIRAITTALLVVSASVAAERSGPFWGALIASLPVSAGPAYVFLAMRHGVDFITNSALSSFAANAATGLFLIIYALTGTLAPGWPALGFAITSWLAASAAVQQVMWTPATAALVNLIVYGLGIVLLRTVGIPRPQIERQFRRRWFELPVRGVAVAGFVSLVLGGSAFLGPAATGIAAVFPISLISLIIIVRARLGASASSLLAANALSPMLGFGIMLLCLHLAIRPLGMTMAFVAALLVSACWSTLLLYTNNLRR